MSGYTDDARRLWKITECYRRVEKCRKASLITYLNS